MYVCVCVVLCGIVDEFLNVFCVFVYCMSKVEFVFFVSHISHISHILGLSMHPVESTLYFTAALIPSFFLSHPLHFFICKTDLAVGALVGHDGFNAPGGGSHFHYLHHAHFEINYGDKVLARTGAHTNTAIYMREIDHINYGDYGTRTQICMRISKPGCSC